VAALAALAITACAAGPEPEQVPPPPSSFQALDDNADGELHVAEWEGHGAELHAALDTDGDGVVTEAEFEAGFARFDLDGDGVITAEEADIAALDTDGDGRIGQAEWRGLVLVRGFDAGGDGRVSRDEFQARRSNSFSSLDRDLNGRISRNELAENAFGFTVLRF
jgi:Ca2+-binding EF-hand superfamily protein